MTEWKPIIKNPKLLDPMPTEKGQYLVYSIHDHWFKVAYYENGEFLDLDNYFDIYERFTHWADIEPPEVEE